MHFAIILEFLLILDWNLSSKEAEVVELQTASHVGANPVQ